MTKNRERKGLFVGLVGVACNLILATAKLIIGLLSKSVSIQSDAINNFGDVISSGATSISFAISKKKADKDHPFGHGRMEYVMSLAVAALICIVGVEFFKNSVDKIINPTPIKFSILGFYIVLGSIFAKIGLGLFYHYSNKTIQSPSLKVAMADSFQDCIMTFGTLISFSLANITTLPIDGIAGLIISVIIILNGLKLIKTTLDPLLGGKQNTLLQTQIKALIMSEDKILGVHDLLIHDYGPTRSIASAHAELDHTLTLTDAHKIIDSLERRISKDLNLEIVLHIDPVDIYDEIAKKYRSLLRTLLSNIDKSLTYHDFQHNTEENFISFHIVIPYGCKIPEKFISEKIDSVSHDDINFDYTYDYN